MLPKIGLSKAATRLEIPIVQVQYRVPKSLSGARTSTKYLEKIKVIIKDVILSIQENDIAKLRAKISSHTRALDVTSQIIETL